MTEREVQAGDAVPSGMWIVAQAGTPPAGEPIPVGVPQASGTTPVQGASGGPAGAPLPRSAPPGADFMWIIMAVLLVMTVMTVLTGRKEKKRRAELLNSMKKSDKVITAGGIIGVVTDMSDDEVVLRLEEGKVRVSKASIQQVLKASLTPAGKPETA